MIKPYGILFLLFISISQFLHAHDSSPKGKSSVLPSKQFFVENKGQWPSEVLYHTQIRGLDAWITRSGITYDFFAFKELPVKQAKPAGHGAQPERARFGQVVKVHNVGANANPKPSGKQKQEAFYNYFIGNDSAKWASNVGLFKEAFVQNVYKGIDQRWYFDGANLRYDYIVNPGADPTQIRLHIEGANNYHVSGNDLVFATRFGKVKQTELLVYQGEQNKKQVVQARWIQQQDNLGFQLGNYNQTLPLIIDPLIYSTFIGGSDYEYPHSIAVDALGNAHIMGSTPSADFPFTPGAYDGFLNSSGGGTYSDYFITKLNPTGTALIYSTFIGGSEDEYPNYNAFSRSMALDGLGNVYLTGTTKSTDYPVTGGAFSNTPAGNTLSYSVVTKLNSSGSALVYSTYLGDNGYSEKCAIAIDPSGNAYVTGSTGNANFPRTPGAYDVSHNGSGDIYISKLNPSGSALVYSTFIGGSAEEYPSSIAVDGGGNAYITGYTTSDNFPVTTGAYDVSHNGVHDVFVTKLNATGTALVYSTYLGGTETEMANDIAIEANGSAIVVGYTNSTFYPTTPGAYDVSINGTSSFITKLSPSGSALLFSTFIGTDYSSGNSVAIDGSGNICVTGYNGEDGYVYKLNIAGSILLYADVIGGSGREFPSGIALDGAGNAYIVGQTNSTNFTVTQNAYDEFYNGIQDAFVVKMKLCSHSTATDIKTACSSYIWIDGNTYTSNNTNAAFTIAGGNSAGCDSIITLNLTITPAPATPILTIVNNCGSSQITATGVLPANTLVWSNGATGNPITLTSGTVTLVQIAGACTSAVSNSVTANPVVAPAAPVLVVVNECGSSKVTASGLASGASITWSNGATGNPISLTTGSVTATQTAAGCPSVLSNTATAAPLQSTTGNDIKSACESFTWINGTTYSSSNTSATYTIENRAGCDSVITLNLTIKRNTSATDIITTCAAHTWIDGITYVENNNTATHTIPNAVGCDSLVTLNLTIATIDTSVSILGTTLTAAQAGASYQWIDCDNGNTHLPNQTGRSFTASASGRYAVIIIFCEISDTSACWLVQCQAALASFTYEQMEGYRIAFTNTSPNRNSSAWVFYNPITGDSASSSDENPEFTWPFEGTYPVKLTVGNSCGEPNTIVEDVIVEKRVGIHDIEDPLLSLYPNPTVGRVYISTTDGSLPVSVIVHDSPGRIVANGADHLSLGYIDLSTLPPGIYVIRVNFAGTTGQLIRKVVKQ